MKAPLGSILFVLAAVACVLFPPASRPARGAADRPWLEVTSPHFVVLSDAGEGAARRVAWQFEQVRAVLQKLWPWARVEPDWPVVVFAVRNERALRDLLPEFWEKKGGVRPTSLFVSGTDRHWVALRVDVPELDSTEGNPYRASYWSYVYLVLTWSFPKPLPLWLARGTSEFFANTIVREKDIQVGRVLRGHLDVLRAMPLVPLATLLAVDDQSPYINRQTEAQIFDASAWAYVHYLVFGERGSNRDRFNQFIRSLHDGAKPDEALRDSYGDLSRLETVVRRYVSDSAFVYQQLGLDVDVSSQAFRVGPLSPAQVTAANAALHAATGPAARARALAQEAMRADAALASPYEVQGLLCDREGKKDEARAAYAKAVELGSTNARVHYRHAQLLWREDPDTATLARIEKSLVEATRLNPNYALPHSYLADVLVSLDRPADALESAKKAVVLDPGGSYHHAAMARALGALSKREEALSEAERALWLARDDNERQRAERLIDWLKKQGA